MSAAGHEARHEVGSECRTSRADLRYRQSADHQLLTKAMDGASIVGNPGILLPTVIKCA